MFNGDDDIEVLEFTQEDKNQALESQLQEMRGKYSASIMNRILEKSYEKKPDLSGDVYFTKHALIFSPSTDKVECDLPLIEKLIGSLEGQDVSSDIFLFPIAEQQPLIKIPFMTDLGWIPPRNHWVTLHYNTKTEIATVIDSRSSLHSIMYSYAELKNSFAKGLQKLRLSIKEFNVIQQRLQADDIFCGAWTAINIESLAYGASITSLTTTFKRDDIDLIVQHLIEKVFHEKKGVLRQDLINDDVINGLKITAPDVQPIIKKLLSHTDADSIATLINHRGNMVFNGKPLSILNPILAKNLGVVIKDLLKKYQCLSIGQVVSLSSDMTGYTIRDPGRLFNNLINIGLNEKEINAFSLIEIIFYDGVIFYATSEIETQVQMQILQMLAKENESTMLAGSEYLNQQNYQVREKILPILKEKILEHYRHQMNTRMMQQLSIKSLMPARELLINQEPNLTYAVQYLRRLLLNTKSILNVGLHEGHKKNLLLVEAPQILNETKDFYQCESEKSSDSRSCFDCLWAIMESICLFLTKILEKITMSNNRNPKPF